MPGVAVQVDAALAPEWTRGDGLESLALTGWSPGSITDAFTKKCPSGVTREAAVALVAKLPAAAAPRGWQ